MSKTTKKTIKEEGYTAKDIYVLKGLEPVRKRPGMYIGSTGASGIHHLIWECMDNSLDEAMSGYCKNIQVYLLPDNKIRTVDDGRGIPVDKHPQTGKSALETVMTTLHAGAKFGGKAYQIAGGLHGVGVSVVCALSKHMKAEVCRGSEKYVQEYSEGKPTTKVRKLGVCNRRGTTITFEPDATIFEEVKFDIKKILNHIRQQAYLTPGIKITIYDQRNSSDSLVYNFYFEGGLRSYIKYLVGVAETRNNNIFYIKNEKQGTLVEVALQYAQEMEALEQSFANNIFTGEGGSHLTGFRTALTRVLNDYARKNGYLKEKEENFTGNDVREGLIGVVSVKIKEPQFEGQTKAKLGNPEVKSAVEQVLSEGLTDFLERNPQDARAIIENSLISAKARRAAKAARNTVLRKGVLNGLSLPGKLADCSSSKPEESEIYIVEGDSAGGCFSGNTKIALADGKNLSFKQLITEEKENKKNYCYTVKRDGKVGIGLIKNVRRTKKNTKVIKVILDNNQEIICTPDHKFMMRDTSYKEAKNLSSKDSLMPLHRKISEMGRRITIKGYEMVYCPTKFQWIFTHLLSDMYNLRNNTYSKEDGSDKHHIDFNKLNNNPDNIIRMGKEKHMAYHRKMIKYGLHSDASKEKSKQVHKTKEYREKIKKIMTTPEMRKILSKRAKKQWQNEEYKKYMLKKFLEFYQKDSDYRERNNKLLYESQKKYWNNLENRKRQAERVRKYFQKHSEKIKELSIMAKKQWEDEKLLEWRRKKTREQWTPEFREKRKITYNQTYLNKALSLLKEIFEEYKDIDMKEYIKRREKRNDKSILKYDTICSRFFGGDERKLKDAVLNYNHKIKKIIEISQKIDVYDLEVEGTHNFALASGVFVHNSCKMARDRRFQAILPLKGKILNVERARLDRILTSEEIKSLIIALGASVSQDFNIDKLRYHRIILMSDADVDGAHIRTLLLTLFFRYFREIIEKGYLYIAQPPLYKIQFGKNIEYAYTDADKEEILSSFKKEKAVNINIQRYKGLGEMNPDELWNTTMDPKNRVLLKVEIEDAKEADHIFDVLMGKEVFPRKKFIQIHAKKVKNLDI